MEELSPTWSFSGMKKFLKPGNFFQTAEIVSNLKLCECKHKFTVYKHKLLFRVVLALVVYWFYRLKVAVTYLASDRKLAQIFMIMECMYGILIAFVYQ